jgi:hypothetical protein
MYDVRCTMLDVRTLNIVHLTSNIVHPNIAYLIYQPSLVLQLL